MKAKFDVLWSQESKEQFERITSYLRAEWTQKEVNKFISKLKDFEKIVALFPEIYTESTSGLRRAVLTKHNSAIYRIDRKTHLIRIITIFDNRQSPDKLKQ